jgi:hypothetical protein
MSYIDLSLVSFCRAPLHSAIVGMFFGMILPTRPTIEVQNLLRISSLWHATSLAGKASIGLVSLRYAEVPSSLVASAFRYSTLKDVGVSPVIEPIRELVQVERQILSAYIVVCANDATLEQAPERIEVVCVYLSMYVFAAGVMHSLMAIPEPAKIVVALPFIRNDQVHLVTDRFGDELIQCVLVGAFDDSADHITFARYCSNNSSLPAAARDVALFVPMAILVFATDDSFIHFYDAHELSEICIHHPCPEPMTHVPRSLMGGADLPRDLESTDAIFAVEHLPEYLKPRLEMNVGVLKDGANSDGEAIGGSLGRCACFADPMPRTRFELIDFGVPASWASDTLGPATLHQELFASVVIWESFHELFECHHNEK